MPSTPSLNPDYLPGSYDERNDEARYLFKQGELDEAAAICQRIIERISRLPERRRSHGSTLHDALMRAAILLAEIHAKQADWPALDDLCTRAQAMHPVYAHRWAIEPFMLRIRYGQPQAGIRGLQALAESQPDSFYLWRMLAQAALDVDDLDLAMTASDYAVLLAQPDEDPGDIASYYIVRFKLFRQRGEWHEAAQEWMMACAWDEGMEELREAVVRMFLDAGLYDDALDYLDDESLTAPLADYYRAWIANQRGDQVRARHLWRKIVEADPNDDDLDNPVVRALAYCWLRQPDAALALMLEELASGGLLSMAEALALALAWAMHGDAAAAHANVRLAAGRQISSAQPNKLMPALDWIEFEQLVQNEAVKAELRSYFEAPRPKSP
jgi:tetratricopeptide (TPR) repeat protein